MPPEDMIKFDTTSRDSNHRAVMILGMHRSGTSALTRVLNLCGVELGTDLMKPGFDNPTGFWESQQLVELNDQLLAHLGMTWDSVIPVPRTWEAATHSARPILKGIAARIRQDHASAGPFGVKDPRLSRLWPLWVDVFSQLMIKPYAVLSFRHPLEVAASLRRREGFDMRKSLLLWLLHVLEGEAHTRRVPRVLISYQQLLSDWQEAVSRIDRGLGLNLLAQGQHAAPKIHDFLAPELRHHRAESIVVEEEVKPLLHLAMEVYALLPHLEARPTEVGMQLDRLHLSVLQNFRTLSSAVSRSVSGASHTAPVLDATANELPEARGAGVSVIVPVFNQPEYVHHCLASLFAQAGDVPGFEVIVVDNASDEATRNVLSSAASRYGALRVIRNERNRFFAAACNQGAQAAYGDVLIFLNSDTEVQPGWLDAGLERLAREDRVGIVGARLLYPDGTIQHGGISFLESEQAGYDVWPEHRYRYRDADDPAANQARELAAVTGACMFIPRAVFERVGGFDERYGMYFEDIDLCMKVREQGLSVWYEPRVSIVHAEGGSTENRSQIDRLTLIAAVRFFQIWGGCLADLTEPADLIVDPPADLIEFGERAFYKGDYTVARYAFHRLLDGDPNHPEAHNNLGVLHWKEGDTTQALRHFARALEFAPSEPDFIGNAQQLVSDLGEEELASKLPEFLVRASSDTEGRA